MEQRQDERYNNREEHAHQPIRERERRMRRCKSPEHAQRFLSADGPIASHFRPRRHRLTACGGYFAHPRHFSSGDTTIVVMETA